MTKTQTKDHNKLVANPNANEEEIDLDSQTIKIAHSVKEVEHFITFDSCWEDLERIWRFFKKSEQIKSFEWWFERSFNVRCRSQFIYESTGTAFV